MDMEIQFLHETFLGKDPKLLVDHIRRMGSGEAPLFSTTLSLVYDKLAEKTVAQSVEELAVGMSVNTDDEPAQIARVPAMQTTSPTIEKRRKKKRLRLRKRRNDCD